MRGNRVVVIDLFALHADKAYGFQQYILNLLNYFYDHRENILYDKIIIVCKDTETDLLRKYADKFELKSFRVRNYIHRLWLQSLLPIKLKLSKNDLLISPANTSGLIKKCAEILVVHDLLFKRENWVNRFMRWQRSLYFPISIKKADRIIAISHFTADDLVHYYPTGKEKVEVIYNYMNFEKYTGFKDHDVNEDPYFLTVAMSAIYKNLHIIINAFNRYCELGGKNKLVMIGLISMDSLAGKILSNLPEKTRQRIVVKSNVSNQELGWLYQHSVCYISASLFEGFGMPIVEAMSFNCPVLLSDTAIHREVSLNKGIYYDVHDDMRLATMMMECKFSQQSYSKEMYEVYSENNTSAKYVEVINKMYHKK